MNTLYIKHRLVTSPLSGMLLSLRDFLGLIKCLRHPELALLKREDVMMRAEIAKLVKPDWVCVDVGGHIGSVSHLFRKHAPQGDHVIIEASPTKAVWLRKAFPEAIVHQVAVSDFVGQVSFYENLDNSGFSSLNDRSARGNTVKITAECTTLDRLLADQKRVDLIKIDVEGFEYQVVQGALEILKRFHPVIIFEAGAATDKDIDNESYVSLFRLLGGDLDYDIYPVFGRHFTRGPITEDLFMAYRTYPFMAFNYMAIPRNGMTP